MSEAAAVRTVDALRGADWLTKGGVTTVLSLLGGDGEEARIVGGAVRNALMGLAVGEIDIATTAVPDEVIRRARAASVKYAPTGIDHGTVTLIVAGHPYEVTTLREDVETFGRKAKVAFGRDWARDAARRDFTINSLSVDAEGRVYDYCGGLDDIGARRVRFIGDAATRIAEDYLRILRFFRIHAAYGEGAIDRAGLSACIGGRKGLSTLSAERVRAEILKLLVAPGAAGALQEMGDAGLLTDLLGGVAWHADFSAMVALEQRLALPVDPMRRLAALAVWVREDAARLKQRLRLANAEHRRLDSMAHRWWRLAGLDERQARIRLYRLGVERFRDRVMLARVRVGGDDGYWDGLLTLPRRWPVPLFPLRAADFFSRGLQPGPELGAALARAEQAWIDADFPQGHEEVSAIADAAVIP